MNGMKVLKVGILAGALFGLPVALLAEELPVDPLIGQLGALEPDSEPAGFSFNGKLVPDDEDELREVQSALQEVLPASLDALVGIEVSGASGSGVIVSPTGLVLSAAHVVMAPGSRLKFVMSDGTELDGETLGIIAGTDAGMARIVDEGEYPYVPITTYSNLALGDWCFALGHAGGVDAERGAVVRLGRILRLRGDTMQSDCQLIGGDSGGPIFDMAGRLIGINSRVGMNIEQSLHVAISEFLQHDEDMRRGIAIGQNLRPLLGLSLEPWPGEEEGDADGATNVSGLLVTDVSRQSSAMRAGLKEGDIILSIDGETVETVSEASDAISRRQAGERVLIRYIPAEDEDGEKNEEGAEVEEWIRLGAREGFSVPG